MMRPVPIARLLLALLCLTVIVTDPRVASAQPSVLSASRNAHGLRISVTIPNAVYTVGRPASATVRLTSNSRHRIFLYGFPASCATSGRNPTIIAVWRNGRPLFLRPGAPPCPRPSVLVLLPGSTLSRTLDFELGRPWIVGRVIVVASRHRGIWELVIIRTPILRVRTAGNAIIPPCRVPEGYPVGYCYDPPGVLSVPTHGMGGAYGLTAVPANHGAWRGGSIVVKASVANPMINDQVPQTVYGQLLIRGKPLVGVQMESTWHYRGGRKTCFGRADVSGVASCREMPLAFKIGGLDRVTVTVAFIYQGSRYAVNTGYRASHD